MNRKGDVEFTDFGTRLRPDSQMSFCFKDKVLHIHLIRRNPGFLFSKIKTHAYKIKSLNIPGSNIK